MTQARLVGSVHIEHPGASERMHGARSRTYLLIDRGLKSEKLDMVELKPSQLLDLAAEAIQTYKLVRDPTDSN